MKTLRQLLVLCCILPWIASVHAKSTVDVTLGRVENVTIEEDKVTIIAKAVTQMRILTDNFITNGQGQSMGSSTDFVRVISDKATFVILRQRPTAADTDVARKVYEEGWEMTIKAAKLLKEGKPVGRIGYYEPQVTIDGPLLTAIKGYGYLYPSGSH